MSEAEKSTEIEDVLSSIRRLVADKPQTKPEPVKPVEVQTAPSEPEVTTEAKIASTEEAKTETASPSFVEKMNASIAEMTQETDDTPNAENEAETESHSEHLDAFLEYVNQEPSETQKTEKTNEPVVVELEKPEPLVLRADMAARQEPPLEAVKAKPATEDTTETVFQETPEADAVEIVMPDDIEDDEAALERKPEQPASGQFIDEETIREIVSEMVRAELQGDLGDRITRNVRKLVRREIHHALTTRELD